jgi:hypothetical protein
MPVQHARRLALALAALTLVLPLLAAAPAPALTRSCGNVGFERNSDNVAWGIRATGVSCRTARAVARRSRNRGPSGRPGTRFSYRALGFRCVGIEADTGLPSVPYRCRRGAARIRFDKN